MVGLAVLLVIAAALAFFAGAIGLGARVSWDQAGKCCLTLAVLAEWGPWR